MRFLSVLLIFILVFSCKKKTEKGTLLSQAVIQDYADLFTPFEEDSLSKIILNYEKNSSNEICIYTIDSIPNKDNIVVTASKLANQLGVGKANKNNGLFLLIAKNNRKVAFATGHSTEKILTDSICKKLIDSTLIPHFKNDAFFEGVIKILDSTQLKWNN